MKFTIVAGDYWEGLYVDGKLVHQNHSVPLDVFAKHAELEFEEFFCDDEWLIESGTLPVNLKDVKLDNL